MTQKTYLQHLVCFCTGKLYLQGQWVNGWSGTGSIADFQNLHVMHSTLHWLSSTSKNSNVIVKAYWTFKFLTSFCWTPYLGRRIRPEWELSDLLKWSSRTCGVSSKLLSEALKCMHTHFLPPKLGLVWSFLMIAHCVIKNNVYSDTTCVKF